MLKWQSYSDTEQISGCQCYNYGEGMIMKRLHESFFVVIGKFCILIIVVVIGIYTCEQIS